MSEARLFYKGQKLKPKDLLWICGNFENEMKENLDIENKVKYEKIKTNRDKLLFLANFYEKRFSDKKTDYKEFWYDGKTVEYRIFNFIRCQLEQEDNERYETLERTREFNKKIIEKYMEQIISNEKAQGTK